MTLLAVMALFSDPIIVKQKPFIRLGTTEKKNENDVTRKSFERKMHDASCDRINDKNICHDTSIESQFKSSGKVNFFFNFRFLR